MALSWELLMNLFQNLKNGRPDYIFPKDLADNIFNSQTTTRIVKKASSSAAPSGAARRECGISELEVIRLNEFAVSLLQ